MNDTLKTIGNLRTIHWNFNDKLVTDEDLATIISSGMKAANSANIANYTVIVIDEQEKMKKIVGNSGNARCCVFCVDYTRLIASANVLGYDYEPGQSWYGLLSDCYDVYGFAQTCVISAKSIGIDSLVTNGIFRVDMKELKNLLELPEKYCFPLISVLFGYSNKPIEETTGRPDINQILNFDKYRKPDINELNSFIQEMDNIYPEYMNDKYQHTLDWYLNEWICNAKGRENELPSKIDIQLAEHLKKAGYYFDMVDNC